MGRFMFILEDMRQALVGGGLIIHVTAMVGTIPNMGGAIRQNDECKALATVTQPGRLGFGTVPGFFN